MSERDRGERERESGERRIVEDCKRAPLTLLVGSGRRGRRVLSFEAAGRCSLVWLLSRIEWRLATTRKVAAAAKISRGLGSSFAGKTVLLTGGYDVDDATRHRRCWRIVDGRGGGMLSHVRDRA